MQIAAAVALVESIYGAIPEPVKAGIVDAVMAAAKKYGSPHVAKAYGRALTKSVDVAVGQLAAAVPDGPDRATKAAALLAGIVKQSRDAATAVGDAVSQYAPLALSVELSRSDPKALAAARAARKAWKAQQAPAIQQALDQLIGA